MCQFSRGFICRRLRRGFSRGFSTGGQHKQGVQQVGTHQGFLGVVGLVSGGLPPPAAAVAQPVLEGGGGVCIEGMLQQVGPVLHAPPVPPTLAGPV